MLRPSLVAIIVTSLAITPSVSTAERHGGNLIGHRGLLRTLSALNHPQGLIGIGADLQYFKASGFLSQTHDHSRLINSYSISIAPLSFLEAALALHMISDNGTDAGVEELQVAVGDPELSIKGGYAFPSGLAAGGAFDLRFPSGSGFFQPAGSATTVSLSGLASWAAPGNSLGVHLNLGFVIDGSKNLFDQPDQLSATQRFAAQISSFNRFVARVGAEYDTSYVSPFLELSLEPYVGGGAPGFGDSPGILTIGTRIWPSQERGFQALAALDIGLTGVGDGSAPTLDAGKYAVVIPRWNLVVRLSYRFDPFVKPAGPREPIIETPPPPPPPAPPKRGVVTGRVVDDRTGKPVWNAHIQLQGSDASRLVVNASDGSFRTFELEAGKRSVTATAEGYGSQTVEVEVGPGQTADVTVRLKARVAFKPGLIRGTVTALGGKPAKGVTVLIPELDRTVTLDSSGAFSVSLPPGNYRLVVSGRGFRAQRKSIRLMEGQTVILNLELHRR